MFLSHNSVQPSTVKLPAIYWYLVILRTEGFLCAMYSHNFKAACHLTG